MIDDIKEMEGISKDFYQNLLTSQLSSGDMTYLLSGVDRCISDSDNSFLMASYTEDETLGVLKEMEKMKVPGCGNFLVVFFQIYWHIVRREVISFCLNVLNNSLDFVSLNVTTIVLIPKVVSPTSVALQTY